MPKMSLPNVKTAEQLFELPPDDHRYELLSGELVTMSPASPLHGSVAMRVANHLANFVLQRGLGEVFAAETGFLLARDPDTVLAPDVAFVQAERLHGLFERGFYAGAPDLAVEVVSRGDSGPRVHAKATSWLAHGTRLVWVVDPRERSVRIYSGQHAISVATVDDLLDGGELLPGFSVAVAHLFPPGHD